MNKNVVWIRHIEKLYKNGHINRDEFDENHHLHDPGIRFEEDTIYILENLIDNLITKYGAPKTIIVSPYLRTRQTAELFLNILEENYRLEPKIRYSTEIAEYLGFCVKNTYSLKADLDIETRKHFNFVVYLGESLGHFKSRVKKHLDYIKECNENVWIITHGFVISNICNFYNIYNKDRPKPLDYLVMKNNQFIKSF